MVFLATFLRDGYVGGFKNGGDFVGLWRSRRGWRGRLAAVLKEEVEVGFVGGAAALFWRRVRAVSGVM